MARRIMVQGTTSNAGKSFLCAALCRIFRQDGWSVAPFKSQNMALNSFITEEGLEMGRAQVMQAEAAGIPPSVRMNPILLKPMSDVGSQVIVNGVPRGNMPAREYFAYKKQLIPDILEAYGSLAEEHDIIVIEGAGSPAEINLKADDIVNMGLAKLVDAPVLLCGDIDRGGVFASLYGTAALLDPEERSLLRGFVINKFRGDAEILRPGLSMLEDLTHIPTVGVVPMIDVDLDDEDSLSSRLDRRETVGLIDIAVIRLPKLSNFTDFNPLERLPEVSLRYVSSPRELKTPDLIILPGTKNTLADLRWLRQCGLESAIRKYADRGGAVVGICGGYQMLGESISDPDGVEGGGTLAGLGLLPGHTVFRGEKTRTRVEGQFHCLDGLFAGMDGVSFGGYEIHMGETTPTGGSSAVSCGTLRSLDGIEKEDGMICGNVWGSYVHGIFDRGTCASALVNCLRRAKGLEDRSAVLDWADYQERQYDILADAVRGALDMERIYQIMDREDTI
ncbi:cobyric acid synthase [Pseudoflavonifractor sp. MSJ-37]|uniref:cobyric acid synthase n=1 Tax=Pseudoflavonifractor sp. MSJ-37 TaxID=2841531 RepID=UPI001C0F7223|nr:cobyric acid synthase [Pseudoflavonifractor sp. MSJ-37]MBU5434729.1 cobyric acid synthase [Pseudoflavonifractor sp. MSJ-37]